MNHGYLVYSAYIRPENLGQRKFAVHMPLAFGLWHMHRKLPLAEVGGSYIRGIHQVTIIHIIYTLIDAIFSKVVYM